MHVKIVKRIASLVAAVLVLCSVTVPAYADGSVTYFGSARSFVFLPGSDASPTDLFDSFKSVMPGDTLTQSVKLSSSSSNTAGVKLYLRALGAVSGSETFLSQLTMTVSASSSKLFDAPASDTAQLTDWVYLGTLQPGGSAELTVTLSVPLTLDNSFQDAVGSLEWQFMAEDMSVSPSPTPSPFPTPRPTRNPLSPVKTGDSASLLWPVLALVSAALLVPSLLILRRGSKHQ